MSTIELFNFENSELRFVEKDNTFEIVVQDLVSIFEYSESRRVLDLVEEDYQGMAFFDTPSGKQELRTIKEPNKINNRVVYHSSEFCYLEQALSNTLGLD